MKSITFRCFLFVCVTLLSACASMTKELDLSHGASPDETAVIRVAFGEEKKGKSPWNPSGSMITWLHSIKNLSGDNGKTIKLSNAWSAYSGKHPRVYPGKYQISVGCEQAGLVSLNKTFQLTLDVKAGETYLLECLGSAKNVRVDIRKK